MSHLFSVEIMTRDHEDGARERPLQRVIEDLFDRLDKLEARVTELETAKPVEIDMSDITDRLDDLESKIDDKIEKYDFRSEVEDVIRDLSFSISID